MESLLKIFLFVYIFITGDGFQFVMGAIPYRNTKTQSLKKVIIINYAVEIANKI